MGNIIQFTIKSLEKGKPCLPSLNQYIEICRSNKFGANSWKHKYQDIIGKQIAEQCENFYINIPFRLDLIICESNRRRDKDNIESLAKKLILDTLQETNYIKNDKLYMGGNTIFTYKKDNSYIEVELYTDI